MERYITFIRNVMTGEEMVSTRTAPSASHEHVMKQEMRKYPAPKYRVHTTYTEGELSDTLESVRRMAGSTWMPAQSQPTVEGSDVGFKTGVSY